MPSRGEQGVGLVALPWGVLVYVMFLMLAVHVAVHLFTTSVVTAVGHDAARRAALAGGSHAGVIEAERWLRSRIGPGVDIELLEWSVTTDVVALELVADPPDVLIGSSALLGQRRIERRFEVRRELARFDPPS